MSNYVCIILVPWGDKAERRSIRVCLEFLLLFFQEKRSVEKIRIALAFLEHFLFASPKRNKKEPGNRLRPDFRWSPDLAVVLLWLQHLYCRQDLIILADYQCKFAC